MGTAERPSAAEREIEAQTQFARLGSGEAQVVEKLVGEIRKIVVDFQRIHRLHFEAPYTAFFHEAHLALQFRFLHGGAEPPPADHHAGVVRWMLELAPQVSYACRNRGR